MLTAGSLLSIRPARRHAYGDAAPKCENPAAAFAAAGSPWGSKVSSFYRFGNQSAISRAADSSESEP